MLNRLNLLTKSIIIGAIFSIAGCTTLQRSEEARVTTVVVEPDKVVVNVVPRNIGDPLSAEDLELASKMGEVPDYAHQYIIKWLDYFQGRGRDHMERYLTRSTRYMPLMKQILKEEGVPEDLVYIALIESGFNARAHSWAAAVGYWQFIRPTGKRYNLKITNLLDERKDPVASTRAAANYFKTLYGMFDSWHLSMASYNTGEGRVKRMVRRYNTKDFWEIVRRRSLPRETRNYVPKFLAAKLIAYNPRRFGFQNLEYHEELSFDSVRTDFGVSLKKIAESLNVPLDQLKQLNPAFISDYVPYYKNYTTRIRVPKGMGPMTLASLENAKSTAPKYIAGNGFTYRVRRGDVLSTIARRYGTTVTALRYANGISRRGFIRVGQRLRIPERQVRVRSSNTRNVAAISSGQIYRVQKGDTLSTIAERFGVGLSRLRRANGITRRSIIRIGQRLKIPTDSKKETAKVTNTTSAANKRSYKIYHNVRSGENLSLIADKYRTSVVRIRKLNHLRRGRVIYPGQRLLVRRDSKVHIVKRGETLGRIARKYNVSQGQLQAMNSIDRPSELFVGNRLFIPVSNN